MAYCTQADLEKLVPVQELAELTTESGGQPESEVVEVCLARAAAEIDAYLAGRYVVPFNPVPERVKSLAVDLAIYHLYSRRGVMPEIREKNYQKALACLRELAGGQARLLVAGQEAARLEGPDSRLSQATERVFSRAALRDF
jgi:phage gp36-like protein